MPHSGTGADPKSPIAVLVNSSRRSLRFQIAAKIGERPFFEAIHAAGFGSYPKIAFTVLDNRLHILTAQTIFGGVTLQACRTHTAKPAALCSNPNHFLIVLVDGMHGSIRRKTLLGAIVRHLASVEYVQPLILSSDP